MRFRPVSRTRPFIVFPLKKVLQKRPACPGISTRLARRVASVEGSGAKMMPWGRIQYNLHLPARIHCLVDFSARKRIICVANRTNFGGGTKKKPLYGFSRGSPWSATLRKTVKRRVSDLALRASLHACVRFQILPLFGSSLKKSVSKRRTCLGIAMRLARQNIGREEWRDKNTWNLYAIRSPCIQTGPVACKRTRKRLVT